MLFNIANTMIEMDDDTTAQILRNGTDTHKNKVKKRWVMQREKLLFQFRWIQDSGIRM